MIMHDELTQVDIDKMKEELQHRIQVLRPQLIEEVKVARSFGDLSENFEYKAAKREKNRNDSRIRYLENMIKTAVVIDGTAAGDGVALFDKVTFYLEEEETEETIQLVTTLRQDALKGLISKESPVGKALLGHQVGDRVCIHVSDSYHYYVQIRKIEKTGEDPDIPISTFGKQRSPLPGGTPGRAFGSGFSSVHASERARQAKAKGLSKGALGQISRETGYPTPRRSQCTGCGRG
ncbi:MAG: GreA/GreB family elongation factor [Evtepia gabavorous]